MKLNNKMKTVLSELILAVFFMTGTFGIAMAENDNANKTKKADESQSYDITLKEVDVWGKKEKKEENPDGSAESGYRVWMFQAGPLGRLKLQDAPYSISVSSADLIKNLQANSVDDVLKYNPTVYNSNGSNSVGLGGFFAIRGFETSNIGTNSSTAVDGMRTYFNANPVEDKESIEVMNGAESFLYGISNPAGMVNYILKRPTTTPIADVTIGNYGGDQAYIHGDFGGPLNNNGKLYYRLNVVDSKKGDAGISGQIHDRSLFSTAVDWHLSEKSLLSFDYSHSTYDIYGGDNIFSIGSKITAIPAVPDASKNFMPPYTSATDTTDRYGLKFTQKMNDGLTFRTAFCYNDNLIYRKRGYVDLINNSGDYTLSYKLWKKDQLTRQGYAYLDMAMRTGTVDHKITFGYSNDYVTEKYAYPYANKSIKLSGIYNIYDAVSFPTDNVLYGNALGTPNKLTEATRLTSTLLVDQINLNNKWSMLVGGNYATINDRNWSYTTAGVATEKPQNTASILVPVVGLMYKPTPGISTYMSYTQALQPGLLAPSTAANAFESMNPYVANQAEVGVKTKINCVDLNLALFRIEKANGYTDAVTNIYSQDGREVHKGLELSATGKLSKNLNIIGGFTILDAKITQASNLSQIGKTPSAVPEKIAKLYAEYTVPSVPGLTLIGGFSYIGKQWVDGNNQNTLSIPGVITTDVGVRYKCKIDDQDVIWRLSVTNVTNKNYWTSTGGGTLTLGYPRIVRLSAEFPFR